MPTFQPPTDNWHSYSDFDIQMPKTQRVRLAYRLLRHIQNSPQGRNVYKLTSGAYTENDPEDSSLIATTYYGGHIYDITTEEAADLTANGYGAYIT